MDQRESHRQSQEEQNKVVVSQGDYDDDDENYGSNRNPGEPLSESKQSEEDEEELFLESNISRVLTERTTKIVICLVLILLFILPFFQDSTWFTVSDQADFGLKVVVDMYD